MKATKELVRCYIYGRVSTEEQARKEDNSLPTQEKFCQRYIALRELEGWKKIETIFDPGFSAKDLNRPGMQRLIEEIEAGNVDVVLVYKIDRLTRSIQDFYKLWEVMEAHGVQFASATEQFDTSTPFGRAMLNILLVFAQFERETTSQRLIDKFSEEARDGKKHPGMNPFGYDADRENRSLVPNREEGPVAEEIFKLAIQMKSVAPVAKTLNARGLRTKTRVYKTGQSGQRLIGGKPWTVKTVMRVITNPLYKGIRLGPDGCEYKALWKPLVSAKVWQEANEAVKPRDSVPARASSRNKHELALKGVLHCGHCKCAMSPKPGGKRGTNGEQRPYYTCQEVIRYGKASPCEVRSLPGKAFDAFVVRAIGEMGQRPELIKSTLEGTLREMQKSLRPLKAELSIVTKKIREYSTEMEKCLAVAKKRGAQGFTTALLAEADKLAQAKAASEREQSRLKAEIKCRENMSADEELTAEALRNFEQLYQHISFKERIELMSLLIRSIHVTAITPEEASTRIVPGTFTAKMRTSWYRLDFDFFIKDLFSKPSVKGGKSSHLGSNGGEGGIRTR